VAQWKAEMMDQKGVRVFSGVFCTLRLVVHSGEEGKVCCSVEKKYALIRVLLLRPHSVVVEEGKGRNDKEERGGSCKATAEVAAAMTVCLMNWV
jgi:hypothetical protein